MGEEVKFLEGDACVDNSEWGVQTIVLYPKGTDPDDLCDGPVAVVPWDDYRKMSELYEDATAYSSLRLPGAS
jgi:hypothetical protein